MSLQIGRVILGETDIRPFEETWSSDGRTVTLSGISHTGQGLSVAQLAALHDDLLGLGDSLVAVSFGTKSHRNAFYTVIGSKSSLIHLGGEAVVRVEWEVNLRREGSMSEVDLETRFAGPLTRANDFTLTGTRWTAPPVVHSAFWAGSESPGAVNRVSEEGTIKVYTQLTTVQPAVRYVCDPLAYELGGARVLDDTGDRTGTGMTLPPTTWELNNGLIGLQWVTDHFELFFYDGSAWKSKTFYLTVDTNNTGAPSAVSVLYNHPERVTIRLVWNVSAVRVTADVTLRRGARFVEMVLKKPVASTLGVGQVTGPASAGFVGGMRDAANDADGHRFVVGSARSFDSDTGNGWIWKNATTRFDIMVGVELGGTAAVAGDTGPELLAQYLGAPSETVVAVRR